MELPENSLERDNSVGGLDDLSNVNAPESVMKSKKDKDKKKKKKRDKSEKKMKIKDFNQDEGQDDEDIDNIIQNQRNKLDGDRHTALDPV